MWLLVVEYISKNFPRHEKIRCHIFISEAQLGRLNCGVFVRSYVVTANTALIAVSSTAGATMKRKNFTSKRGQYEQDTLRLNQVSAVCLHSIRYIKSMYKKTCVRNHHRLYLRITQQISSLHLCTMGLATITSIRKDIDFKWKRFF